MGSWPIPCIFGEKKKTEHAHLPVGELDCFPSTLAGGLGDMVLLNNIWSFCDLQFWLHPDLETRKGER